MRDPMKIFLKTTLSPGRGMLHPFRIRITSIFLHMEVRMTDQADFPSRLHNKCPQQFDQNQELGSEFRSAG